MALYLLSDIASSPRIGLLLSGGLTLGIGIWVLSATKPEEQPRSNRFRILKQMKERSQKPERQKKSKKS